MLAKLSLKLDTLEVISVGKLIESLLSDERNPAIVLKVLSEIIVETNK